MGLDDKSQRLGETLVAIRDAFQGFQKAIEAIDSFLNFLDKELEPPEEAPYNKMFWEKREGQKGPFEMTSEKNCGNVDSFRHLVAIMKQNNRRFTEKAWTHYYWLGKDDDDTIFRREKTAKQ